MRSSPQTYLTMLLVFIIVSMWFVSHRLNGEDQRRHPQISRPVSSATGEKVIISPKVDDENVPLTNVLLGASKATSDESVDPFVRYASDAHLRSLLLQQGNSLKQVIVTIIGGDSYSLFAWDWHERMLEISNDTKKCHCFVIAMDEIAVVLAIQQGVPVFYSTFSFEQQMQWKNTIEVRQHSLYRVGHAKFSATARIIKLGYSVLLSEMDVFWRLNPLDYLKNASLKYDLQISHHYGAHPRVNIGVFYIQSSPGSIEFFSQVAEFWLRYGKGGFLADQRVLDALLNNYDRLDPTYLQAMKFVRKCSFNWTTHDFGNHYAHLMTDGSAFTLFSQAAKISKRSKKYHGLVQPNFFTVPVTNPNMSVSDRNLLVRALLILQHTHLKNRTFILPAFTPNVTILPITYQLDIKKFFLYWTEERIRLPEFVLLEKSRTIPNTSLSFSSEKTYDDIPGIIEFSIDSIPLNLPAPSAQFEVQVRDSLLWCSPPRMGGEWCIHHPRDYGATMEILFACRGDPYPPCANKTERNEQFLKRPYQTT